AKQRARRRWGHAGSSWPGDRDAGLLCAGARRAASAPVCPPLLVLGLYGRGSQWLHRSRRSSRSGFLLQREPSVLLLEREQCPDCIHIVVDVRLGSLV